MDRWAGRTAVVTGASAGIGAAACLALADAGMRVVGLARRTHMIDDLTPQIKGSGSITSRQCDVSNLEEIAAVFAWVQERFGGTDVLINNAGIFRSGHITDVGDAKLSDEDILSVIDVNFKAVVMCARNAIASMRTRGVDGHIVNINSVAGHYQPVTPEFNIYPATKHAVTAATKSLLAEISSFQNKIKVTSISPGLVETEMTAEFLASAPVPALKAKDIADAVLYAVGTPANVNVLIR